MSDHDFVSRKGFFGEFFSLFKKTVANQVDKKLASSLEAPIRPPGALDELEFLSACTRCGACSQACPYHAIQTMPLQSGVAANTPYIEARTQACRLCEDYPCIAACEDDALLPLNGARPAMGKAIVNKDACRAYDDKVCTLCYDACPFPEEAIVIDDAFHPQILEGCVGCGLCEQRCPTVPVGVAALSPTRARAVQLEDELYFGLFAKEADDAPK